MQRFREIASFFMFAAIPVSTATAADAEAIVGQPFGVAEVTLTFPAADIGLPAARAAITVDGPAGRVLYPTVTDGVMTRLLGPKPSRSARLTVMFLFRGSEPFDAVIRTPTAQRVTITPQNKSDFVHRRKVRQWWRGYNGLFRDLAEESEHPPVLETYLTSMLARRLGLAEPLAERLRAERKDNEGRQTLELLSGAQAVRMQIVKATSLGELPSSPVADQPLPAGVSWPIPSMPEFDADVEVEPLAMRVPEECFYVRFGQYSNFLWLNALMEDYGGEIENMISARGHRTDLSERIQDQLAMKQGALAEILGPQAIADVAAIGMDTFTREGAAIGAIFEAKNSLLGIDLKRQRQEALVREEDNGSKLEDVQIGGRTVSFLSTPDNRLRSFYLVDGKYHLVTNSRTIVERFLAVADGKGALGTNEEFRFARTVVSTSRDDTIFVYFSSAFFRNLLSARYQIELQRRLQASTDIELITMAQLAAKAENKSSESVRDLIAADVLPPQFGERADGSRPLIEGKRIADSLRGSHGFFTPVPDVKVSSVSKGERDHYMRQAAFYAENWRQVDPVLIALKRYALDEDRAERITFEAFITPMDDFKYHVAMSMLGEPSPYKLVPPDNTVISVDAAVRGGILFPSVPAHRLFVGVQDHDPLSRSRPDNVLRLLQILRTAPGYLGGWPKPGFIDLLPFISSSRSEDGFSALPLGILRWQGRGFSVVSMDKGILTKASQQLGFVEDGRPSQFRLNIGDLSSAKFGSWLNQMGYERARQVSVANVRFMGILNQQFKVPLDETRDVAERLLAAELVCSLGGEYEVAPQGGGKLWKSSAWPATFDYELPEGYITPPLDWFRGLEAMLVKHPDRLVVRGHVDMQRKEKEPAIKLPFFKLFGEKKEVEEGSQEEWKPRDY